MKPTIAITIALLAVGGPIGAKAPPAIPPAVARAIADPLRPPGDVVRDAKRHPAELLAFAGVRPGDKIADFIMGGGYFTRLLARAVGPAGRVYAYQPGEFIRFKAQYGEDQRAVASAYANVQALNQPFASVSFPEPLDRIITVQNYHDLHLGVLPPDTAAKVAQAWYKALKPGGTLIVVDHAAAPKSGLRDVNALHRIDPLSVRRELEAAGFRFDGSSAILRNPADPRTANVYDPAIRGSTDQFVYRFRKPRRSRSPG